MQILQTPLGIQTSLLGTSRPLGQPRSLLYHPQMLNQRFTVLGNTKGMSLILPALLARSPQFLQADYQPLNESNFEFPFVDLEPFQEPRLNTAGQINEDNTSFVSESFFNSDLPDQELSSSHPSPQAPDGMPDFKLIPSPAPDRTYIEYSSVDADIQPFLTDSEENNSNASTVEPSSLHAAHISEQAIVKVSSSPKNHSEIKQKAKRHKKQNLEKKVVAAKVDTAKADAAKTDRKTSTKTPKNDRKIQQETERKTASKQHTSTQENDQLNEALQAKPRREKKTRVIPDFVAFQTAEIAVSEADTFTSIPDDPIASRQPIEGIPVPSPELEAASNSEVSAAEFNLPYNDDRSLSIETSMQPQSNDQLLSEPTKIDNELLENKQLPKLVKGDEQVEKQPSKSRRTKAGKPKGNKGKLLLPEQIKTQESSDNLKSLPDAPIDQQNSSVDLTVLSTDVNSPTHTESNSAVSKSSSRSVNLNSIKQGSWNNPNTLLTPDLPPDDSHSANSSPAVPKLNSFDLRADSFNLTAPQLNRTDLHSTDSSSAKPEIDKSQKFQSENALNQSRITSSQARISKNTVEKNELNNFDNSLVNQLLIDNFPNTDTGKQARFINEHAELDDTANSSVEHFSLTQSAKDTTQKQLPVVPEATKLDQLAVSAQSLRSSQPPQPSGEIDLSQERSAELQNELLHQPDLIQPQQALPHFSNQFSQSPPSSPSEPISEEQSQPNSSEVVHKFTVSTPPQGFSVGGHVTVSPPAKPIDPSDTVPAMLTPGEFVINAEDAQKHLPLLHHINQGKSLENAPIPTQKSELSPDGPATDIPSTTNPSNIATKSASVQPKRAKDSLNSSTLGSTLLVESQELSSLKPLQSGTFDDFASDSNSSQTSYSSPPRIFRSKLPSPSSFSSPSSLEWSSVEDLLGMDSEPATHPTAHSTATHPVMSQQSIWQGFAQGGEVVAPATETVSATETITSSSAAGENAAEETRAAIETLAQEIYSRLQQRLMIERERQGFYSGRLPW